MRHRRGIAALPLAALALHPVVRYLYRSLSYADAAPTGTGSHVGPHR